MLFDFDPIRDRIQDVRLSIRNNTQGMESWYKVLSSTLRRSAIEHCCCVSLTCFYLQTGKEVKPGVNNDSLRYRFIESVASIGRRVA